MNTICSEEFWATLKNLAAEEKLSLKVYYATTGLDTRKKELEPIILGLIKAAPTPTLPKIKSSYSYMQFNIVSIDEVVCYDSKEEKYSVRCNINFTTI